MKPLHPALEPLLGPLKDFQRRTVDYVFKRMYLDDPPARRFLVADEVGLGKTLVARGIITRVLHHLYENIDRIDIIYVCSNAAIAKQNLNRLNVTGEEDLAFATRLTLLPAQVKNLRGNKINVVSFTPGTTFDLKSSGGRKEERADIHRMLEGHLGLPTTGLRNLLQCTVGFENWKNLLERRRARRELDADLARTFVDRVGKTQDLLERLREGCRRFGRYRRNVPPEDESFRYGLIGDLRKGLADMCIEALEPDLVILDEFQRFRDLLDGEDAASRLAQALMDYGDARVLLLSATPYKMLTLTGEEDEDHYEDFMRTVGFLLDDPVQKSALERRFSEYRRSLLRPRAAGAAGSKGTRESIEETLLSVMTRTERVSSTADRDAMLRDVVHEASIERADLRQAQLVDQVARAVESYDPIEYWKSAPYLLNVMKDYKLKEEFRKGIAKRNPVVREALGRFQDQLLRQSDVEQYREIDPGNGRLRALIGDMVEPGHWRLLWMPPGLPYWRHGGSFVGREDVTKSLVFSSWTVVPDVIAAVASYVAERNMLGVGNERIPYSELTKERKPLLVFRMKGDEPQSMTSLGLLYPCATLAREVDPLSIALELGHGEAPPIEDVRREAKKIVERKLVEADLWPPDSDQLPDPRWYWAAPGLLDRVHTEGMKSWIGRSWRSTGPARGSGESGYTDHVRLYDRAMSGGLDLGPPPADLLDVLVDLALAGPAVCALRALGRVTGAERLDEPHLLDASVDVAEGLRSLFNNPETTAMLRADDPDRPYWQHVLDYGMDGNLPALLDEYFHVLKESLGLVRHDAPKVAEEIAAAAREALTIRTSVIRVDEYSPMRGGGVKEDEFRLRCRFAVRFGELKDDTGATLARAGSVREAFNSPFRPFILASTSIGQEGLDFHTYCHAVYHWNLPNNPVDLEQREGRVHRYKGHAVRKNVARKFGLAALGERRNGRHPWDTLFDLAREDRPPGSSDLIPYWIYGGDAKVERRVPMLPFSREEGQLKRLKSSLAVYRLAFGQPRQEDLLEYLEGEFEEGEEFGDPDAMRISLAPQEVELEQEISSGFVRFLEGREEQRVSSGAPEGRSRTGLTDTQRARLDFWKTFGEYVEARGGSVGLHKPNSESWTNIAIGRTGIAIVAVVTRSEARVELYVSGEDADRCFEALWSQRGKIENELRIPLKWKNRANRKSSKIYVQREADVRDRSLWPGLQAWMLGQIEAFKAVFGHRVENL